jgi:hypothetical protein
MRKDYIIQDVITKEYYQVDGSFSTNIKGSKVLFIPSQISEVSGLEGRYLRVETIYRTEERQQTESFLAQPIHVTEDDFLRNTKNK